MFRGQNVSAQAEHTRRPQLRQWCLRFSRNPNVESHTAHLAEMMPGVRVEKSRRQERGRCWKVGSAKTKVGYANQRASIPRVSPLADSAKAGMSGSPVPC